MNTDMALKVLWVAVGIVIAFTIWTFVPSLTTAAPSSNTTTP